MAALSLTAFIMVEIRRTQPMLPLGFFRQRTFSGATAVGFLLNMALYGMLFVLGLYFQTTRHWTARLSGIAFLPLPVVLGLANVFAERVGRHITAPAAMAAGLLLAAIGTGLLTGLGATTPYGLILISLVLIPAGIGVVVPLMTASLLGTVPQAHAGVASGVLNAMRQTGGAIGVALFGGLAAVPDHGLRNVFLLATALLIAASVVAAGLIPMVKPGQQPAGGSTKQAISLRDATERCSCTKSPNPRSYISAPRSF